MARSYDAGGRLIAEVMTIDAGAIAGSGTGATVTATTTTVGYTYDAAIGRTPPEERFTLRVLQGWKRMAEQRALVLGLTEIASR